MGYLTRMKTTRVKQESESDKNNSNKVVPEKHKNKERLREGKTPIQGLTRAEVLALMLPVGRYSSLTLIRLNNINECAYIYINILSTRTVGVCIHVFIIILYLHDLYQI